LNFVTFFCSGNWHEPVLGHSKPVVKLVRGELGPPRFEVVSQDSTGLADGGVVLVEHLAVGEDEPDVVDELLARLVHRRVQLLLDGGQVHRGLDDLLVRRELLRVDRVQERPGVEFIKLFSVSHRCSGQNASVCPWQSLQP